jgi:sugar/nucleoside kinase (ribokinase family)
VTLVGVGHALADAFAFVDEDVPKVMGLHPGSFNQVPDYRMRAILATMRQKSLMAGGSAANTVKLAARLGLDTHFVGQCGHDEAGLTFESEMLEAGVKTSLTRSDSPTGLCVTFLSSEGRTSATFRSASGGLAPGLVSDTLLDAADIVVAEGYLLDEPEFLSDLLERCRRRSKAVALDVGQGMVDRHGDSLMAHLESGAIGHLFLHEADAATLTGLGADGAAPLLGRHARVVIHRETETLVFRNGEATTIPRPEAETVDATGADDGFVAGFLWGLSRSASTARACRAGLLVAACVARQPGTRVEDALWARLKAELDGLGLARV